MPDALSLAAQDFGDVSKKRRIVIAHGLFGAGRNWGVIAKRLAGDRRVTTVDMRNHGDSPWSDNHDYPSMAADLAALIDEPVHVIGHSMGGKAAMALALMYPEKVDKLVVADIAPVTYSHTQMSVLDAMAGLSLSGIDRRSEANERLSDTLPDPGVRAFVLQSLDIANHRWSLNLDTLRAEMPKIMSFPQMSGSFFGPSLFLAGGNSDYVKTEQQPGILALFPNALFQTIPDAGHWLHAENPRAFEASVSTFLDGTTPG
ncbi:MAG: alpha/beta fold hydrolase [Pseudomonadota bacterium]